MEDTEAPSPSPPNLSLADLITGLEKHLVVDLDATVAHLQSANKDGSLKTKVLKAEAQKALTLSQASLLIRTVRLSLKVPLLKDSLSTEDLIQKTHQTTERLKAVCQDQARHMLAVKAAKILEQIEAKEKLIRDQVALKQKAIAKLVQDRTASVSKR